MWTVATRLNNVICTYNLAKFRGSKCWGRSSDVSWTFTRRLRNVFNTKFSEIWTDTLADSFQLKKGCVLDGFHTYEQSITAQITKINFNEIM